MNERSIKASGLAVSAIFSRAALFIAAACIPAFGAEPIEHLIIAPPDLAAAAVKLSKHRRAAGLDSLVVETADLQSVEGSYEQDEVKDLVRKYWELTARGLKYLLIMGDAPGPGRPADASRIPPKILAPRYSDKRWSCAKDVASDAWYAMMDDDGIPDMAVGRLPADDPAEAMRMVDRIIAYETAMDHGVWRKRINVVAGQGGFGPMVDMMLEAQFRKIMEKELDLAFDVKLLYANPRSPFFFPPPKFAQKALELFAEGSLVSGYVGHGSPDSFDDFTFRGVIYRIMNPSDAARLRVKEGSPIMVVIACSTGHFDHPDRDCITEKLLNAPGGPVAVISSTRVSQPYPNGIIAKRFLALASSVNPPTVGGALATIRSEMGSFEPSAAGDMDKMAALMMGPQNLKPCLDDHVHLYNLFGDPAMPIGAPRSRVTVEAQATAVAGGSVAIRSTLDDHRGIDMAAVTIEPLRGSTAHPLSRPDQSSPEAERFAAIEENWKALNEPAIASCAARCENGRVSVTLSLPPDITPGEYLVKVYCYGPHGSALGCVKITITAGDGRNSDDDEF